MYANSPDSVMVRTITVLKPVMGSTRSPVDVGRGEGGEGEVVVVDGVIGPATVGTAEQDMHN